MNSEYAGAVTSRFRDIGAEARVRELRSLHQEMILKADPVTPTLLSDWVSGSSNRTALLLGSVWGGIRWPKAMGRPATASIADGFSVVHEFQPDKRVDLGGHSENLAPFVVQPAPSVWDASSSSDYRVGFFFYAGDLKGVNANRLTVRLASVTWQLGALVSPGTLRLNPYGYANFATFGERIVFPDFEVVHQPYMRNQSIHPLGPLKDVRP